MRSFSCSLDTFLNVNNVIVFSFRKQILKWRSFEIKDFLTYFSHFLVSREKTQPSAHMSLT